MSRRDAYIRNELQLQNSSLIFIHKSKPLLLATSIVVHLVQPWLTNTTASLDKLIGTDYVDFGEWQDRFGRLPWSKNDSNYLDVELKVIKLRVSTGTKFYKRRGRCQPVDAIEESAGHCSRNFR